jgi:hypothetical protein
MAAPKKATSPTPLGALIDEAASLDLEIAPIRRKIARLDELKSAIRLAFKDKDADATHQAVGDKFRAILGEKASVATIDIPGLIKAVGWKVAMPILSTTLKALEATCPAAIPLVVTRAATGTRSLEFVAKGTD